MAKGDYARIERAIRFLVDNYREQPDLTQTARHVRLSTYHFQRLFKRWAGVSPKRFLQFLTVEHAKKQLRDCKSVLEASNESGLSSPSRLYDLFVSVEAMTPGDFKENGRDLSITYGFHGSPFGEYLLAVTERGICGLEFVTKADRNVTLERLVGQFRAARFRRDKKQTMPIAEKIISVLNGDQTCNVSLLLKGTNFQINVWRALLSIPPGALVTYEDVAKSAGRPNAVRATGHAVAKNPVALLIPCHRVIRSNGAIGGYRWGLDRKRALVGFEAAQKELSVASCQ